MFSQSGYPVAHARNIKMLNLSMFHHTNFGELLGRVRLGIFRNKNIFRNIFWLFCSEGQNSQNGNPGIPE